MVSAGNPVSLEVVYVDTNLYLGKIIPVEDKINLLSEQMNMVYSEAIAGKADSFDFRWKYAKENESGVINTNEMQHYPEGDGQTRLLLGRKGASLSQQVNRMFTLQYRARPGSIAEALVGTNWSDCTDMALAEGWATRVLNALTPFEQRMEDLYDNAVETDVSMVQQAGPPYEGDVALNMNNMTDIGLLQLYTTLQNLLAKGFESDTNAINAAAQKQLLLAASRLNDLYMVLGDEAYVDAMDPTIQYGYNMTAAGTSLDIDFDTHAGSLFCFENQVSSLLEEELALLRGRDGAAFCQNGMQPPVTDTPYFNRLPWNFTKGLMAGEVAYAMNYNIQGANQAIIDENTAAELYPQGHGDAWGYYQMALRQYMNLMRNPHYTLGPGATAMDLGGNPVNINYYDQNKCAESAAALARTGSEILRRVRRKAYAEDSDSVFPGLYDSNSNRAWGVGEWAARVGEGACLNWILANSMLPGDEAGGEMTQSSLSTNITRASATGLGALKSAYVNLQREIDNADSRLNPLGLTDGSIPFDINPNAIDAGQTHFEQILARAEQSVANAAQSLENAQKFSLTSRRNQENGNSLADELANEEAAWTRRLIEIYGYPFSDDIGPGKTYAQGYEGPDLFHWMYMDLEDYYVSDPLMISDFTYDMKTETMTIHNEYVEGFAVAAGFFGAADAGFDMLAGQILKEIKGETISGDLQESAISRMVKMAMQIGEYVAAVEEMYDITESPDTSPTITFHVNGEGIPIKPSHWSGMRRAEGELQAACADFLNNYGMVSIKTNAVNRALAKMKFTYASVDTGINLMIAKQVFSYLNDASSAIKSSTEATVAKLQAKAQQSLDNIDAKNKTGEEMGDLQVIVGFSDSVNAPQVFTSATLQSLAAVKQTLASIDAAVKKAQLEIIAIINSFAQTTLAKVNLVYEVKEKLEGYRSQITSATVAAQAAITEYESLLIELQQAQQKIFTLQAEAERVQEARERVRTLRAQQVASLRYADMLFRVFQNDAIRQYQSLFDLAARQTYLAAQAYAYETAMSPTDQQLDPEYQFLNRIIQARTIGSLDENGNPIASGDIGDGGLANVLARLKANWAVLDGRLGFNNPETETGRFSLRQELFRILPGVDGDEAWRRTLRQYWVEDLYTVPEFSAYCIPFASSEKQAEPALVIPFSTDITFGRNFFGRELAGGDNAYDSSHFATKIRSLGIWFSNYNNGTNFNGMANNPRVYLLPVGLDIMRTPDKLAQEAFSDDGSSLCAWNVLDQALDVPYPLSETELNDSSWIPLLTSGASEMCRIRRYPSMRAYHDAGEVDDSEMISNARLIGRSVWNTRWLLIIPAGTLNTDRDKGLDYFIDGVDGNGGVSDIKLMFKTYSHAGN